MRARGRLSCARDHSLQLEYHRCGSCATPERRKAHESCSRAFTGHGAAILCASFSPTGSSLATGSGDTTARLWDLDTETPRATLAGHSGWVLCVEWDGLERFVATGSMDNTVRISLPHQLIVALADLDWHRSDCGTQRMASRSVAPSLGTASGSRASHGNPSTCKSHSRSLVRLARAHRCLRSSGSRPRFASSSKDGTVRVWNAQTGALEFTLGSHTASVNCVRWGGENVIYTASSDRTVKLWDGKDVHIRFIACSRCLPPLTVST